MYCINLLYLCIYIYIYTLATGKTNRSRAQPQRSMRPPATTLSGVIEIQALYGTSYVGTGTSTSNLTVKCCAWWLQGVATNHLVACPCSLFRFLPINDALSLPRSPLCLFPPSGNGVTEISNVFPSISAFRAKSANALPLWNRALEMAQEGISILQRLKS